MARKNAFGNKRTSYGRKNVSFSAKKKKATLRKRIVKALLTVLCVLLILTAGAFAYLLLPVIPYYNASEKGFLIPGLSDGFVPQGIAYDERADVFFISGSYPDGTASAVCTVDAADGKGRRTVYLHHEGGVFSNEASGVAVAGGYVYIAGGKDGCVYVFPREAILTAVSGGSVDSVGVFRTAFSESDAICPEFIVADGGYIYVGERYHTPDGTTPESHFIATSGGDYNRALCVGYALDPDAPLGIDPSPRAAYSLPENVQGMAVTQDKIYLCTSKGLAFSHIYAYDASLLKMSKTLLPGTNVPIYELDKSSRRLDIKAPLMCEEIALAGGRIYTMCSSASNKYFFGKVTGNSWCYATDMSKFE